MADVRYLASARGGELQPGVDADGKLIRQGEGVAQIAILIDRDRLVCRSKRCHFAGDKQNLDGDRDGLACGAARECNRYVLSVDDATRHCSDGKCQLEHRRAVPRVDGHG
jgi:hypothetical protein